MLLSDLHACGHVRGEVVAREINANYPNDEMVCKAELLMSDMPRTHVMVFQRAFRKDMLSKLQHARDRGIACIYDIDDDYLNTPPEFIKPFQFYSQPEVREGIMGFLSGSTAITCSTDYMANAIVPYTKDIPKFVVENGIDLEFWLAMRTAKRHDGITIGYMASGSHCIDAPLFLDALHIIMDRYTTVKVDLIGWVGWNEMGSKFTKYANRIQCRPWIDVHALPEAMSQYDIGLCPLVDNQFNRCKSPIKWMQYAAVGAASVCSRLDPYNCVEHGKTGLVVGSAKDEWVDAIDALVQNEALRMKLADDALAAIKQRHTVKLMAAAYMKAWRMALGR
jgi:glycosyltransferase involved in cell wall biosynthesis